jgi:hypothetical protein
MFGFDSRPIDTVRVARVPGAGRSATGEGWALENGDNVLRLLPPGVEPPLTAEAFGLYGAGAALPERLGSETTR